MKKINEKSPLESIKGLVNKKLYKGNYEIALDYMRKGYTAEKAALIVAKIDVYTLQDMWDELGETFVSKKAQDYLEELKAKKNMAEEGETPFNSAGDSASVDMNITGMKRDRRSKWDQDNMYRRARGDFLPKSFIEQLKNKK